MKAVEFGVEREGGECRFCSNHDVMYPDRELPIFKSKNVICRRVQAFFKGSRYLKTQQPAFFSSQTIIFAVAKGLVMLGQIQEQSRLP